MVVAPANHLAWRKGRRSEIAKARRSGVQLREDSDFAPFWQQVLAPRLAERYGVKPVHSVDEISLLAARFPGRIRQFSAYWNDTIVAGATVYETPTVAHVQYSGVTHEGQATGALDLLYSWLIEQRYADRRWFDFGTCNEDEGRALNGGLADWKEAFGGRTFVHEFYQVQTDYPKLEPCLAGTWADTAPPEAEDSGYSLLDPPVLLS